MVIYTLMPLIILLVINNRHYAVKYFFHYNHGPNVKNCNYFKTGCQNFIKAFIFCKYTTSCSRVQFKHLNKEKIRYFFFVFVFVFSVMLTHAIGSILRRHIWMHFPIGRTVLLPCTFIFSQRVELRQCSKRICTKSIGT